MIGRMSEDSLHEMESLAIQLAKEAADISAGQAGRASFTRKPDNSFVTAIDHEIQERIVTAIEKQFPGHAIVAEEGAASAATPPDLASPQYCWVIDPLDGTRNFVAGFPSFATSIGVLDQGRPVMGVIFDHCLGRLYSGVRGEGAFVDGQPMRMEQPPAGTDLLVGVPSSKDRLTVAVSQRWAGTKGLISRNLGSTALHLALVAAGGLSACFCKQSKIWDIAAGMVLIAEAGGVVTDPFGRDPLPFDALPGSEDFPLLAATPTAHRKLVESISDLSAT